MKKALISHIHDGLDGSRPFEWVDFTPTINQGGAVSATIVRARYCLLGKIALVHIEANITGSGTGTPKIEIAGIPAAIAPKFFSGTNVSGVGHYYDQSTNTYYVGAAYFPTATTVTILASGNADYVGATPAITAANLDQMQVNLAYEIA